MNFVHPAVAVLGAEPVVSASLRSEPVLPLFGRSRFGAKGYWKPAEGWLKSAETYFHPWGGNRL